MIYMSEGSNPDGKGKDDKGRDITVTVDRSPEIQRIQDELSARVKELEEKQRLIDEKNREFEKVKDESEQRRAQLEQIALQEFEKRKNKLIENAKAALVDKDGKTDDVKVKEIESRITTPDSLAQVEFMVGMLRDSLAARAAS